MYRPSSSDSYHTEYLAWPDLVSRRCNCCGIPLKFAHADNGKLIHTLQGDIHQIVYYYTCPNEKCGQHNQYINPAPRYDYEKNYYGKDVINLVSREIFIFKQNPEQIHLRLTLNYSLDISLRTVQRMYNDCILVKAGQIDRKTEEEICGNKGIILAADGQDPGSGLDAIWLFTDCLSGRVLHTQQTKAMPSNKLQEVVHQILKKYQTSLLGFVSDKQNSLVKCLQVYFPQVPHQYCTWHFAGHLWDHLEVFDSQIYTFLKSGINRLYIHSKSSTSQAFFEGHGKLLIRNVFQEIDGDLQKLLKFRSKRFQSLRGLAIYRSLKRYIKDMNKGLSHFTRSTRFEKIYQKTLEILQHLVEEVQERFFEALFMYDTFKVLYQLLYMPNLERANRQQQLDNVMGYCWVVAKIKEPALRMEDLRSYNPKVSSTCSEILGEWIRLWNSYLSGLFAYYEFPILRRTNIAQEQAFSVEKAALNRRMANKEVSYMQELQGDFYLRFSHCSEEELHADIVDEYMKSEIRTLRAAYHQKVKKVTENWFYRAEPLQGIQTTLAKYGKYESSPNNLSTSEKSKKSYRKTIQNNLKRKNGKKNMPN